MGLFGHFILLYPFSPLSPALWETARYRLKYWVWEVHPVDTLILSSHFFFCQTFLLYSFTVPCATVFTIPEDIAMWPNLSFHFLTKVRSFSYFPMATWIFLRTSTKEANVHKRRGWGGGEEKNIRNDTNQPPYW